MKRNDLTEIKQLKVSEILIKVSAIKKELTDLVIDHNMKKNKDTKMMSKKRKDIAQMLTIVNQKRLLEELEMQNKKGVL